MIDKQSLFDAFQRSTDQLVVALQAFPAQKFNTAPSESAWSAAMLADHLLQLEKRIRHIIISPGKPTERPPGEKLPLIKSTLENVSVKLKSPSFILPSQAPAEKDV